MAAWGPNPGHPADFDGNGAVDVVDFLMLLANWGPCGSQQAQALTDEEIKIIQESLEEQLSKEEYNKIIREYKEELREFGLDLEDYEEVNNKRISVKGVFNYLLNLFNNLRNTITLHLTNL